VLRLQRRVVASRRTVLVLAGILVACVLVFVVYLGPSLLVRGHSPLTPAERLKAENDVRTTLLQAIAGTILLAGLYFTGRTFQLNREGQVTERFTRAIDQLGHENQDVRVGGIYALERIAQSSRRDHGPIVEVLTTFVREHQSWRGDEAPGTESGFATRPRADIQAILRVLGRRRWEWDEGERIDLSGTDLRDVSLAGARLKAADLHGAHLERSDLSGTQLEDASLEESHLDGARIQDANLRDVSLNRASLEGAWLNNVDLSGATLDAARLTGAYFSLVNLVGVSLGLTTTFRDVTLHDVDLRDTWLTGYHLDGAWIAGGTQLKLPALNPFDGRIWVADHTRGKLIAVVPTGGKPPSTRELEEFRFENSEFRDQTDSFRFADRARPMAS
jgi:hypothetical protein